MSEGSQRQKNLTISGKLTLGTNAVLRVQKKGLDGFDQILPTSESTEFVKNFATLTLAIAGKGIVDSDSFIVEERTTGNGGGATWDAVLLSSVTPSIGEPTVGNIVTSVGVPTLAFVLRVGSEFTAESMGSIGDNSTLNDTAANAIILLAETNGLSVDYQNGTHLHLGNYPLRQGGTPTSLKDFNGITIFSSGTAIVATKAADGADVFQLNGVKNVNIRDIGATSTITGGSPTAGSNAVSITAGGHNIAIDRVRAINMPFVEKASNLDGGKGFTIQVAQVLTKNIRIRKCKVIGDSTNGTGSIGLNLDMTGADALVNKPQQIEFSGNTVEGNFRGSSVGYSDTLTSSLEIDGIDIVVRNNQFLNCQQGGAHGRLTGFMFIDNDIISTLTAAVTYATFTDTERFGLSIAGVFKSNFNGNNIFYADCTSFIKYGGTTAASATIKFSDFNNISNNHCYGVASGFGIAAIEVGGNSARNTNFIGNSVVGGASGDIDTIFYQVISANNIIGDGATNRLTKLGIATLGDFTDSDFSVNGILGIAFTDGLQNLNTMFRDTDNATAFKTNVSSNASQLQLKIQSNAGADKVSFRNDGGIGTASLITNTNTPSGATVKAVPIYDETGAIAGFMPAYATEW